MRHAGDAARRARRAADDEGVTHPRVLALLTMAEHIGDQFGATTPDAMVRMVAVPAVDGTEVATEAERLIRLGYSLPRWSRPEGTS